MWFVPKLTRSQPLLLLKTREMILEQQGYTVYPVQGLSVRV